MVDFLSSVSARAMKVLLSRCPEIVDWPVFSMIFLILNATVMCV